MFNLTFNDTLVKIDIFLFRTNILLINKKRLLIKMYLGKPLRAYWQSEIFLRLPLENHKNALLIIFLFL